MNCPVGPLKLTCTRIANVTTISNLPTIDWAIVVEEGKSRVREDKAGCCDDDDESESGQGCVLQSNVSMNFPTQSFPPFCGNGLMQNRLRLSKPPSQLSEQVSNSTHSLQPPSWDENTQFRGFQPFCAHVPQNINIETCAPHKRFWKVNIAWYSKIL